MKQLSWLSIAFCGGSILASEYSLLLQASMFLTGLGFFILFLIDYSRKV